MKIILVPIEPFEERYSIQWSRWFKESISNLDIPYIEICPEPLKSYRETGAFLDVVGTNYFKATQLQMICDLIDRGEIESGDVFLFHDLWFPGIEMLAYIRDGMGMDFKITGCLHAGTWDPWDFLSRRNMGRWGTLLEESWFKFIDAVFVATEFHKEMIQSYFDSPIPRIYTTGFPIKNEEELPNTGKNQVVFPHRLDKEKNPDRFDKLEKAFTSEYPLPKVTFLKTKEACTTKKEYYEVLANSVVSVSFASQETWGIAMIESVLSGCIPFVPNELSYGELYPKEFRYDYDFSDDHSYFLLAKRIHEALRNTEYQNMVEDLGKKFILKGSLAIPRMIEIIMDL